MPGASVFISLGRRKRPKKGRRPGCVLQLEMLENRLCPSSNPVFWTNPNGGDWNTPGNWSGNAVPGPSDNAVINMPGVIITHGQDVADSVNSLTSAATIFFSSGSLSIAAASTVANLSLSRGTLSGPGDLTVSGVLTWSGGTMSGSGTTTAQDGMSLAGNANALYLEGRTLFNVATVTSSAQLVVSNAAAINNQHGATWKFLGQSWVYSSDGTGTFHDFGTLIHPGNDGATFTWNYNADGSLASVTELDSAARTITWTYDQAVIDKIEERDTDTDGSHTEFAWDYNGTSLVAASRKDYDSDGSLAAEITWTYNADGSLASVEEQDLGSDGSHIDHEWNYSGNALASVSEKDYDVQGTLATQVTWTYNAGGSLADIQKQDNHSDGTRTDCEWIYQGGSLASAIEKDFDAQGSLVKQVTWTWSDNGSLDHILEQDHKSDGTQTAYHWGYQSGGGAPASPPSFWLASATKQDFNSQGAVVTTVAWTYNADGSLAAVQQQDNYSDGTKTEFGWSYQGGSLTSASQKDFDAAGTLLTEIDWAQSASGSLSSVKEQNHKSDGTQSDYEWNYQGGSLVSISEKDFDANGFQVTEITWSYNAQGALTSIDEQDENSDGSTTYYCWDYNGSLPGGGLTSATQVDVRPDGSGSSIEWDFRADGSLASVTSLDYIAGVAQAAGSWTAALLNNIVQYFATPPQTFLEHAVLWSYNNDGSLAYIQELFNDPSGAQSEYQWDYLGGALASVVQADINADDSGTGQAWVLSAGATAAGVLTNIIASAFEVDFSAGGALLRNFAWGAPLDTSLLFSLVQQLATERTVAFEHNPDGSLDSIEEEFFYPDGSTTEFTWDYANGLLDKVSQIDTNADGSGSNVEWDYNNGVLVSVRQTDFNADGSTALIVTWSFNPDGSLASIEERHTSSEGPAQLTWEYNADGSLAAVSALFTNADGSTDSFEWTYSGAALISYRVVSTNTDGSADNEQWDFNGDGTLDRISQHHQAGDGSSTDSEWDYQAGELVSVMVTDTRADSSKAGRHWTYDGGSLVTVTDWENNADASGFSNQWDYNINGTVHSVVAREQNSDGSSRFYQWDYNSAGTLISLHEMQTAANGSGTSYLWEYDSTAALQSASKATNTNGSVTGYGWTYQNGRPTSAMKWQTDPNGHGSSYLVNFTPSGGVASLGEAATMPDGSETDNLWTYDSGVLNFVRNKLSHPDGSWTENDWYFNFGTWSLWVTTHSADGSETVNDGGHLPPPPPPTVVFVAVPAPSEATDPPPRVVPTAPQAPTAPDGVPPEAPTPLDATAPLAPTPPPEAAAPDAPIAPSVPAAPAAPGNPAALPPAPQEVPAPTAPTAPTAMAAPTLPTAPAAPTLPDLPSLLPPPGSGGGGVPDNQDHVPPFSSVDALPLFSRRSFSVSWLGQDNPGGSGIAGYDVYVSDNGKAFAPFVVGTTANSAVFTGGQDHHSYTFFSIAHDNAGNIQAVPGAVQSTTVVFPADQLAIQVPSQAIAGGIFQANVQALGPKGLDPLYEGTVALSVIAGPPGGKLSGDTVVALHNGIATFNNLALGPAGGGYQLLAATADNLAPAASNLIAVSSTTHFAVSGAPASQVADQAFTITVKALDALNHTDTGYFGTIHFSSTDPQAVLPADYTFVAADHGVKTFNVTLRTAGSQTITVADISKPSAKGTSSTVKVSAVAVSALAVTGLPPMGSSGVPQSFTVTALDAFGNRVVGHHGTVHFDSSDPHAVLPADYTFTASDKGAHTFQATLMSLGSQAVTASDVANQSVISNSTASSVTSGEANINIVSPATHLGISAGPATAGQQFTITVTALNSANLTDALFQDIIHFTSNDPQAELPADYTFLPEDQGTKTFTITLKTAGKPAIMAADTTRPAIKGSSSVAVSAAAASSLIVSGYPAMARSGVAGKFIVTALDAFGNRAASYNGTVHVTSSDLQAVLPADYTFTAADKGAHSLTAKLKSLGSQSITATDTVTGNIRGTQSAINVVAPATHLSITGLPKSAGAGNQLTIKVTALDADNKADGLFQETVHFTSSDPQAVLPADYTFVAADHGVKTFTITLKTAGTRKIMVANIGQLAIKGSATVSVKAAAASTLTLKGFPSATLVGAAHSVTVTALDPFGNRATGYRGKIHFTSSDVQATLPNDYTFTAKDNGKHTFSVAFNTAGSQSMTATDIANGSIAGSLGNITVANLTVAIIGPFVGVRGQPLTFTLTASEDGAPAGTPFTFRIDWDGNGTVDQVVSGPSGATVSHAYSVNGVNTVEVTVVDSAGNVGPKKATHTVTIAAVALLTDPANSTQTALFVGGTRADDTIIITPADPTGQTIAVSINGVQAGGLFAPTGHLLVYGQAGKDTIKLVAKAINGLPALIGIPAVLLGGPGNDTLSAAGSRANNVLVGAAGNDSLTAGGGRDIVIGGAGADVLRAGSRGAILIAGGTAHDADLTALLALAIEWARADRNYQDRIRDLQGYGSGGLNGPYLLIPQSLIPDSAIDQLFGGTEADWFWFSKSDKINSYTAGEAARFA